MGDERYKYEHLLNKLDEGWTHEPESYKLADESAEAIRELIEKCDDLENDRDRAYDSRNELKAEIKNLKKAVWKKASLAEKAYSNY